MRRGSWGGAYMLLGKGEDWGDDYFFVVFLLLMISSLRALFRMWRSL